MPRITDLSSLSDEVRRINGLDVCPQRTPKAAPTPAPGRGSEHAEQAALIALCAAHEAKHPELALLFAVPNGGQRHPAVAAKLRAEGVRAGVPDLFLPVVRGGAPGLWIELKYGKNGLSEHQQEWAERLRAQGYRVEVCRSAESALAALLAYLESEGWG